MATTSTRTVVPGSRRAVPASLPPGAADQLSTLVYAEFLYGIGSAPGVDLGRPLSYTKTGTVYRQDFERGLTFANVGDQASDVNLERPYFDLAQALRTSLTVPAHSAVVLLRNPA